LGIAVEPVLTPVYAPDYSNDQLNGSATTIHARFCDSDVGGLGGGCGRGGQLAGAGLKLEATGFGSGFAASRVVNSERQVQVFQQDAEGASPTALKRTRSV